MKTENLLRASKNSLNTSSSSSMRAQGVSTGLSFELSRFQSELKLKQQTIEAAQREIAALKSSVAAKDRQLQQTTDQCAKMQERAMRADGLLVTQTKEIEQLKALKKKADSQVNELQRQNDKLRDKLAAVGSRLPIGGEQVAILQAEIKSLKAQENKLNDEIKAVNNLLRGKDRELDAAAVKLERAASADQRTKELENSLADINRQLEEAAGRERTLQQTVRQQDNEISRLQREVEKLAESLQAGKLAHQATADSLKLAESKAVDLMSELQLVKDDLSRASAVAARVAASETKSGWLAGEVVPLALHLDEVRYSQGEVLRLRDRVAQLERELQVSDQLKEKLRLQLEAAPVGVVPHRERRTSFATGSVCKPGPGGSKTPRNRSRKASHSARVATPRTRTGEKAWKKPRQEEGKLQVAAQQCRRPSSRGSDAAEVKPQQSSRDARSVSYSPQLEREQQSQVQRVQEQPISEARAVTDSPQTAHEQQLPVQQAKGQLCQELDAVEVEQQQRKVEPTVSYSPAVAREQQTPVQQAEQQLGSEAHTATYSPLESPLQQAVRQLTAQLDAIVVEQRQSSGVAAVESFPQAEVQQRAEVGQQEVVALEIKERAAVLLKQQDSQQHKQQPLVLQDSEGYQQQSKEQPAAQGPQGSVLKAQEEAQEHVMVAENKLKHRAAVTETPVEAQEELKDMATKEEATSEVQQQEAPDSPQQAPRKDQQQGSPSTSSPMAPVLTRAPKEITAALDALPLHPASPFPRALSPCACCPAKPVGPKVSPLSRQSSPASSPPQDDVPVAAAEVQGAGAGMVSDVAEDVEQSAEELLAKGKRGGRVRQAIAAAGAAAAEPSSPPRRQTRSRAKLAAA